MSNNNNLRILLDAAREILEVPPQDKHNPVPAFEVDVPAPVDVPASVNMASNPVLFMEMPILVSEMMPNWYYSGRILQKSFRDACRLVFRAGFREIVNQESVDLVNEGIDLYRLLGSALPTVN